MSQINALSPLDSAARSAPNQFSEMSSEDFIKIIFTELSNQDPFDPSDSTALLQQLNAIRSIESDLKLMQQLQSLVSENQLASAGNLIGKFIGGMTEDHNRVAGWVVAAIKQGDAVHLELDNGWFVPMEGVETILDPSLLDRPPSGAAVPPPPMTGDPPPPPPGDGEPEDENP